MAEASGCRGLVPCCLFPLEVDFFLYRLAPFPLPSRTICAGRQLDLGASGRVSFFVVKQEAESQCSCAPTVGLMWQLPTVGGGFGALPTKPVDGAARLVA